MRKILLLFVLFLLFSMSVVDARAPIPKRSYYGYGSYTVDSVISTATGLKADAVFLYYEKMPFLTDTDIQTIKNVDTAYGTKMQVHLWIDPSWNHTTGVKYDLYNDTVRAARIQYLRDTIEKYPSLDGLNYEELDAQHYIGDPIEKSIALNKFFNETTWLHDSYDLLVSANQPKMGNPILDNGFDRVTINAHRFLDFVILQNGDKLGWGANYTETMAEVNGWQAVMPNVTIMPAMYGFSAATNTYCGKTENGGHSPYSYPTCYSQAFFETIHHVNVVLGNPLAITQLAGIAPPGAAYHWWNSDENDPLNPHIDRMRYWNGSGYQTYNTEPGIDTLIEVVGRIPITNYNGNGTPIITTQPVNITEYEGIPITFFVGAFGSSLSYQWQKNGTNISGATSASYTTPSTTLLDNGSTYRVIVTNSLGSITSSAATLTVQTSANNLITNPGFESGTSSWIFYTSGTGAFTTSSPGYEGANAANVALSSGGSNIQLSQDGITLEPNTRYRLSFAAYSNTGHDMMANLVGINPYSDYGLSQTFNLGTNWQTYTIEFTTKGFTAAVSNGRLQLWLAPFASAGDIYYIDGTKLEKITTPDTSPPSIAITSPSEGQTVTASPVAVSGTASDNVGLGGIQVKANSGIWQPASGTASWSSSVALASGSNTIYANATDASGNSGVASVSVMYGAQPPSLALYISAKTLKDAYARGEYVGLG